MQAELNAEVIKILTMVAHLDGVARSLKLLNESVVLLTGAKTLLKIDPDAIRLLGRDVVDDKLRPEHPSEERMVFDPAILQAFFEALSGSVIRLNHLGISYSCRNIDHEVAAYLALLKDSGLYLYQEPAASEYERWFFIGDRTRWEQPLFELVLTQTDKPFTNQWTPHFQIDLDTNLTIDQLQVLADQHFGKGFFKWLFDIPNYGVVLATGRLANIRGAKIYLALGTNLRGTEWHRTQGLTDVLQD